ncbi:MAG: hypothetical protein HFG20_06290 [Anaerotruncus sp.]|jgi:hypothetical protein|nr:hypothetical protein [Anaerotruncus sp.]
MQLLRITSQPIKYELSVEPARLEFANVPKNPQGTVHRQPTQMDIRTKDIEVRLDTTEMRASLNLRSVGSWIELFANRGMQKGRAAIGEAVQTGNKMAQIDDGVTVAQIAQQKMMERASFETYTTFIPSAGVQTDWDPATVNLDYQPGSVQTEWQIEQNVMNYVPGKFHIEVLQYPKIEIEYLGEPVYVPASAAPGYES